MKLKHLLGFAAAALVGIGIAKVMDDPKTIRVSAADFGEAWPLTVESGDVSCRNKGEAVFIHGSTTYALNGIAKRNDTAAIEDISKPHPMFDDIKMPSQPLIDAALKLCKS